MPRLLGPQPNPKPVEAVRREESISLSPAVENDPLINPKPEEPVLACPICNETMISLTQLNQHLDDEHSDKSPIVPIGLANAPKSKKSLSSANISRKHWVEAAPGQTCAHESCSVPVERNGINCRQCGLLFCRPHSVYAKKLEKSAQPDPANGIWARVCRGCFESRPGFDDNSGMLRDLTFSFKKKRQTHVDSRRLVVERLENRMVKLVVGLSKMDRERGLFSYKDVQRKREFERDLVPWENEVLVPRCRICNQRFSYFLRRHHCRICGLVVCGDMDRDCSRDVAINILAEKLERADLATSSMYAVRVCRDCKDSVFGHKNFLKEIEEPLPELLQLRTHLKRKQAQIDLILPRFQELTAELAGGAVEPGIVNETTTIRQQLLSSFAQFDHLSRRLRSLHTDTQSEATLQKQMTLWTTNYLQDTMVPLQALPHVLQKDEVRLRKDEIESIQNQIVVLEEQKFMVENMINSAKSRRRLDEIGPLERSLGDLQSEIVKLRSKLGSRGNF
ncbi:Vacuolar segregation protein PEP7 [Wickerhamiella sorbophila]|uniref:Vacuolar segregation protein PEP7 n=1 Tax=Wickerhamiella sorbophila TaxID=45607 RepID=A0A2T0FDJ8_9ASCO|nr:Vacuolar segregation protein PEP7 [Wickerhamiella sorbophila]PRT53088.1 Vacuolar segregation protein PEP7 [Wickerhamiella sorbophila]